MILAIVWTKKGWRMAPKMIRSVPIAKAIARSAGLALTFALAGLNARAQDIRGLPSFASFSGSGGVDSVNEGNLNVHLNIPLLHKAGVGLPVDFVVAYDSSIWSPVTNQTTGVTSWTPSGNGFFYGISALFGGLSRVKVQQTGACYDWDYTYGDGNGTVHTFPGIPNTACGGPAIGVAGALDGSGYSVTHNWTANTVTLQDIAGNIITTGASFQGGTRSIKDPNGNQIYSTDGINVFDTLGLNVLSTSSSGNVATYSYTGGNGPQSFAFTTSSISVATSFGCGYQEFSGSLTVVSSIGLPDGSSYGFHYEGAGRLSQVDLPTGGHIYYSYSGVSCTDGTTMTLTRQTSGGSNVTYSRSSGNPNATSTTTITDNTTNPTNQTTVQFIMYAETLSNNYQGTTSGTLLKQVIHCYATTAQPCSTPQGPTSTYSTVSPPPALTVLTSLNGSASSQIVTYYGITEPNGAGVLLNLPTEIDSYDFGNTNILRKEITNYASIGNNILNRPASITVKNGGGNIQAQVNYLNYDAKGNVGTIQSLVQGTTYLSRSYTYNTNGTVKTTNDVNGAQTSYTYQSCGTNSNAFVSNISEPLNLSRSMTWNCNGGVVTQVTDENSQPTTYAYNDPFWRNTSITDALNNTTNISYTPTTSESSLVFNNGASTVDVLRTVDGLGRVKTTQQRQAPGSGNFDTVSRTYDANGRLGSVSMPCVATAGASCPSSPATTYAYDALNRSTQITDGGGGTVADSYKSQDVLVTLGPAPAGENTKQKQYEYDGLGRMVSVCEITNASGSGSCGQANTTGLNFTTAYVTKYTYDAVNRLTQVQQNTQGAPVQTRTFAYDALGRMTSESNPESGTMSGAYDTDATCGTSNGDLVKQTDAVGNVTCYNYDVLHRNASVAHPSGSYASVTPDKCLVYDSATVHGVSMSNAKGRLAEAYTVLNGQGCSASKITDEGFSYSPRGEVSGTWEYTSAFGNWYQSTATYWANGALATLGGPTSVPAFTFGVEGEGRMSSASASFGQNPVTATSYNSSSQVTGVTLGSGDSDGFTFDPNTGRMTQYKATINGTSAFGNPTWNPNGSLKQLAITDPFNSSDTQTCSYSQGDLASIKSVSCGSAWSQTFTYDPFGNITKSGSISWMPGYNTTTNRYTLGGTSYDADGNLLTDTFHTYTWNSDGQPATVNTNTLVTLTYDALGRVAVLNDAGTKTDIAYTPSGRRFAYYPAGAFGGFTLDLPGTLRAGGQTANAGVQSYSHPDWLGSQRVVSASNRAYVGSLAYAPFGETYAKLGNPQLLFTNQSNDIANDLYDFPAREQHGTQGRWISSDPAGLAAVNPSNPQSWNRYAYVANGPMNAVDPLGLACYSFEKEEYGTCAPFMNNGVNFWGDLNEFDLMNIPVVQLIGYVKATAIDPFTGQDLGTSYSPIYAQVGTGFDVQSNQTLFGWDFAAWQTFGRTFLNGVIHGVRQPGQSFTDCVHQNADQTTFGAVDAISIPQISAALVTGGAVGVTATISAPGVSTTAFSQVSGTALPSVSLAQQAGAWLALSSGASIGIAKFSGYVFGGAAKAGAYGTVALVGGIAGLTIGSAINCR